MTEKNNSSKLLIPFQKKYNEFNSRELWGKCYLLTIVNNSFVIKNSFEETEKRILELKTIRIILEVTRNEYDHSERKSLIIQSADCKDSYILNNLELSAQKNFSTDSILVSKVFDLYEKSIEKLKKIKRLEKILVNEVNNYELFLKEINI